MKQDTVLIYVTCASRQEGESIAAALVESRLIACANILPAVISIYRWQGKIEKSNECVLMLKTREKLADTVVERIKVLHSYELPAIVALPLVGGNQDFIEWIMAETAQ